LLFRFGMNFLLGGLLGFAACLVTSLASATPSVSLKPQGGDVASAQQERRWYGWQTLSVDGGAAALGLAALAIELRDVPPNEALTGSLLLGGGLAYMAGGPAIHLLHDRPLQALGSFGLRGGLTLFGGALGLASATCPPPDGEYGNCGLGPLIMGAAAGTIVAMVLDDTLLAWEKPAAGAASQARLGITPFVSKDGHRELRVFGTF
jgi:hypothetical protein